MMVGSSRFFSPYRSLGIVSSGRPFYLIPHDHSGNAMVALPIGERFQLMRTDHLRPALVSQSVPSSSSPSPPAAADRTTRRRRQRSLRDSGGGGGGPPEISHLITDASLSISVVAHGARPPKSASSSSYFAKHVSLFQRTQPLATQRVVPNDDWCIRDLLHLGRVKQMMSGEKQGKLENVAVVAVILGRLVHEDSISDEDRPSPNDNVPTVGEDDDEDDYDDNNEEDDGSSSEDGDNHDNNNNKKKNEEEDDEHDDRDCHCQVIVLIASRQDLRIQNRIRLLTAPHFAPLCAVHPSTYLNKIVIGGFDTQEQRLAMVLLNIRSGKIIHNFTGCFAQQQQQQQKQYTKITTLTQSPAVDTIAVGTNQGMVHLVNLRHDKTLFSLQHSNQRDASKPTAITSISFRTDSSALHYSTAPMAVGRDDGTITIWDLTPPKDDDDDNSNAANNNNNNNNLGRNILCEMANVHTPGGVAKLQFLPQEPLLLSIGTHSNAILMHIFDNPDYSGRILRQRKGHTAPPRCIQYIHPGAGAGGGILANASDGTDASACQILSGGGRDRTLRVFSTARTVADKEYGQGRGLIKKAKRLGMESTTDLLLPPLIGMATCEARSRDWGDLVTIHEDHAMAYVWSTKRGAQSGPVLRQNKWNISAMKVPPPSQAHSTSVAISACGNFALIGCKGGRIYKYNVQSGIPRGSYPKHHSNDHGGLDDDDYEGGKKKKRFFVPGDISRAISALERSKKVSNRASNLDKMELDAEQKQIQERRLQKKLNEASHLGFPVTGIAVDAINKTVVSVGMDGKLILWNLVTHLPHKKSPYKLSSPATKLCLVRDSGLAAIALKDFSVLVFDTMSQSIVRRFGSEGSISAHKGPISDFGFSPDGRSLYTASMDSTMRVWDVPTDSCVDWLSFKTPPTSIAVSPTGEFVTTVHTGNLGLSVWCDRSFYETVYTDGGPPQTPAKMDEPTPLSDHWEQSNLYLGASAQQELSMQQQQARDENAAKDSMGVDPPVPKEEGLVTLSGLAPSHWKNLFSLELVKERNKPKEPPKKPPSAPFFLQWRAGEAVAGGDSDKPKNEKDEWAQAWSDDDDDDDNGAGDNNNNDDDDNVGENDTSYNAQSSSLVLRTKRNVEMSDEAESPKQKKRKTIRHSRSHLASLLLRCSELESEDGANGKRYRSVTEYISNLGPSAIDVALSTLCSGQHDLEEGIPLLRVAAEWLFEETHSRERYEAVNAYLHRFLRLHASILAGIEDEPSFQGNEGENDRATCDMEERAQLTELISQLRKVQSGASNALRNKMQRATCMLRHFSRMV
ncbi:hypothetical protein ACA910_012427 [Epithemia clementina (nom. ined.)]